MDYNTSTSPFPKLQEFVASSSDYLSENLSNLTFVTTCSPESHDCVIDHNKVCVGDPMYCNQTEDEYREMLRDYITPSIPECILIFSHIVVFLLGLVSDGKTRKFRVWGGKLKSNCELWWMECYHSWLINGHSFWIIDKLKTFNISRGVCFN